MDYRPIPGYEGRYSAGSDGSIKSHLTGKTLRPYRARSGHLHVALHKDGVQRSQLVHRLVMLAFVGEPVHGQEVCHVDGNPGNNRIENLRYGSRSENVRDQVEHGVHNNASKTHCAAGHEYTPENTAKRSGGGRRCRTCVADWNRAYQQRKN